MNMNLPGNAKYIAMAIVVSGIFVKYTQKTVRREFIESDDPEDDFNEYIEHIVEPNWTTYITFAFIFGGVVGVLTAPPKGTMTMQPVKARDRIEVRSGPASF
jgi:hypothetical protein